MSKLEFTPGPWCSVVDEAGTSVVWQVGIAKLICETPPAHTPDAKQIGIANAQLIAASPGMLDTLIYLDKMLGHLAVDSDVRVRITAAIDFATGGGK